MKKNKPLLSVLVPVYNVAPYLKECIDSIRNQTFEDVEIICVDDGSTDESGEILDAYAEIDNRIIVIHKKNEGLVSARKEAVKNASGRYATCVDSDDWLELDMFYDLINLAMENDADVVTSGCIREYGKSKSIDGDLLEEGTYRGDRLNKCFLSNMMGKGIGFQQNVKTSIVGKIYKCDLLRTIQTRVDNYVNVGEDAAVIYPCLLNSNCVVVSGSNYYHYRLREGSVAVSKSQNEEKSLLRLESILKHEFLIHGNQVDNAEYQYKTITLFNRLVICPESVIKIQDGMVFPFFNLKEADRIVIYGTGRFGMGVYHVLKGFGMNIVAITDRNLSEGVVSIEQLKNIDFDRIVIAVLKSNLAEEIQSMLNEYGYEGKLSVIDVSLVMA